MPFSVQAFKSMGLQGIVYMICKGRGLTPMYLIKEKYCNFKNKINLNHLQRQNFVHNELKQFHNWMRRLSCHENNA